MKKITYLFLLISGLSFSQLPDIRDFVVTANSNSSYGFGDRFDYEFDIRGNYGYNEIKVWVYLGTKSSKPSQNTDLVSYIRWNREGDDNLNFSNYFTKAMWSNWWSSAISRSNLYGESFTLLVQYGGSNKFLYYTVPNQRPDFTITNATLSAGNDSWNLLDGERPEIPFCSDFCNNPTTTLNFSLKNIGDPNPSSSSDDIKVYISNRNRLGSGNPIWVYKWLASSRIGRLNTGEERSYRLRKQFKYNLETENGLWRLGSGTTYYLHIFWDEGGVLPDLGAGRQHLVFPFKFKDYNNSGKSPILPSFSAYRYQTKIETNLPFEQYTIDIYDLTGRKVMTTDVSNTMEETDTAMKLPSGLYIIKSQKGDRKIYVK